MKYNDKSILESYHCYKALRLLNKESSNILENFSKEENKIFRKRVIGCIFATDMLFHNTVIAKLVDKIDLIVKKEKQENLENINSENLNNISEKKEVENNFNFKEDKEIKVENIQISSKRIKIFYELNENKEDITQKFDLQQDILNYLVHSSDVSNPAKDIAIYSVWTKLVMQEFFNQGDLEKNEGLPVSYLCDRSTVDVPKSQVGFINFIVLPLFKTISFYFPNLFFYEENLKKNCEYFKSIDNFEIKYEI